VGGSILGSMARRATHDSTGRVLPLRRRQPVLFWGSVIMSVLLVLSLMVGSLAVLLS